MTEKFECLKEECDHFKMMGGFLLRDTKGLYGSEQVDAYLTQKCDNTLGCIGDHIPTVAEADGELQVARTRLKAAEARIIALMEETQG